MKKFYAMMLSLMLSLSAGLISVNAQTATTISSNGTTTIDVAKNATKVYSIHLKSAGNLVISGDFDSNYNQNITLCDAENHVIISDTNHWVSNDNGGMSLYMGSYLLAGDYYVEISNNSTVDTLKNALSLKFTPAKSTKLNSVIKDTVMMNEDRSYNFTLKKKSVISVSGTAVKRDQSIIINDSKGRQVAHDQDVQWKNNRLNMKVTLPAGTYTLKVHNQKKGSLSYSFRVSFDQKAATVQFTKVKVQKNAVALKWNKIKNAKYEIRYRQPGKKWMVKQVRGTNYTIKKLASKTQYQVTIRAMIGKNTTAFSSLKTIRIR